MGATNSHSINSSLILNYRFGANPSPQDDGSNPIIALLDKLVESGDQHNRSYSLQLVSCLKILIRATPVVDLPYKVR